MRTASLIIYLFIYLIIIYFYLKYTTLHVSVIKGVRHRGLKL